MEATKVPTVETLAADLYRIAQGVVDPTRAARESLVSCGLPVPSRPEPADTPTPIANEPAEPTSPAPAPSAGDAWLAVEGTVNLKRCPKCGAATLEGFVHCTDCGHEPADDATWRAHPQAPSRPQGREPSGEDWRHRPLDAGARVEEAARQAEIDRLPALAEQMRKILQANPPTPTAPEPSRPDRRQPGWWCCEADYPEHMPTCKNFTDRRRQQERRVGGRRYREDAERNEMRRNRAHDRRADDDRRRRPSGGAE